MIKIYYNFSLRHFLKVIFYLNFQQFF